MMRYATYYFLSLSHTATQEIFSRENGVRRGFVFCRRGIFSSELLLFYAQIQQMKRHTNLMKIRYAAELTQ